MALRAPAKICNTFLPHSEIGTRPEDLSTRKVGLIRQMSTPGFKKANGYGKIALVCRQSNTRGEQTMSTSILYHAFGLQGICYTSTHYNADAVILRAEMTYPLIQCPNCGCRDTTWIQGPGILQTRTVPSPYSGALVNRMNLSFQCRNRHECHRMEKVGASRRESLRFWQNLGKSI